MFMKHSSDTLKTSLLFKNVGDFNAARDIVYRALQSNKTDPVLTCELTHIYYLKQDYVKFEQPLSDTKK